MADILDRFLVQVAARPNAPAVVDHGRTVSYGELHAVASRLAAAIARHGDHPRVLILLDQGWQAYATIIAAVMAGGIYSPINTQSPTARISAIARQFAPDVVVTLSSVLDRFPGLAIAAVHMDFDDERTGLLAQPRPHDDLLYVMFTSGSTGQPKGVMVERASMNHFIDWVIDAVKPDPSDRWSQHPNIAFDMSHLDIFGCLGSGGSLYPLNRPRDRLMPGMAISESRLTLWYSVPGVIGSMAKAGHLTSQHLASLRLMNFAGEPLLPTQLEMLFAVRPDLEVWNTFGPTEATVTVTQCKFFARDYRDHCRASASIGPANPGMHIELAGGPSPNEGEIVIVGPQLARGYWQNPEQTAKSFRPVMVDGQARRGYYTGDWARREGDDIYFLGRIDNQTKIRGVRIELDEVEDILRRIGFNDAAVMVVDEKLHAFLETERNTVDQNEISMALAKTLLPQAIPSAYHLLRTFPRNQNDKVDRGAMRQWLTDKPVPASSRSL